MKQKIDPVGLAADLFEETLYFAVVRNIARKQRRLFAERGGQLLDVFLQPLALIIENQTGAGIRPRLGNSPCDAAFVGDTKNNSNLSFQHTLRHTGSTITGITVAQQQRSAFSAAATRHDFFFNL